MSRDHFKGAAYLFHRWMEAAQSDLEHGGDVKPARVIERFADERVKLTPRRRLVSFLERVRRHA
jgi:hypothetical protein